MIWAVWIKPRISLFEIISHNYLLGFIKVLDQFFKEYKLNRAFHFKIISHDYILGFIKVLDPSFKQYKLNRAF